MGKWSKKAETAKFPRSLICPVTCTWASWENLLVKKANPCEESRSRTRCPTHRGPGHACACGQLSAQTDEEDGVSAFSSAVALFPPQVGKLPGLSGCPKLPEAS